MRAPYILCLLFLLHWTSPGASNTLGSVIGSRGNSNKRKNKAVKITPPLRLKPGETPEQAPGWQHCIKNMRANLAWKNFKSPGYPDFLESQIQCSWIIEAPIGMRVKIAFRDLDMVGATGSCAKQFVQIIDVLTGKSQGRFCGNSRPGDYVTLGTRARIDLQADKAVTKVRGFLISFTAVKEIPGFRSSKTFSAATKGSGDAAPGKVDMKNFLSKSASDDPKTSGTKRGNNKRLKYESDRNPQATDTSGIATEEPSANTVGSDGDTGWIGNDADIGNVPGPTNRQPSGGTLKYRASNANRQRSPRPTNSGGQIIITQSTLPVRIRAKDIVTPSRAPTEEEEREENVGPIIYGKQNQPNDPSLYTTLHPVRGDVNRFVDHRPEILTTTNLIIIIACGVMFLFVLAGIIVFIWFYRKRRSKRRKKKREAKKRERENRSEKEGGLEMNVINLSESNDRDAGMRHRELPGPPPMDLPPRYPERREFSLPRDDAIDHHDHGEFPVRDQRGRQLPTISRSGMPDIQPREDIRYPPRDHRPYSPQGRRYPGNPVDVRHHTVNPRRQQPRVPPSQLRHHSLDPRNLERDHQMDKRRMDFRDKPQPRYPPQNIQRGNPPRHQNGQFPRGVARPGPFPNGITGVEDVDEDYCSGSENDGSGKARMRREYSPWELEKQKRERKKKLINGEI